MLICTGGDYGVDHPTQGGGLGTERAGGREGAFFAFYYYYFARHCLDVPLFLISICPLWSTSRFVDSLRNSGLDIHMFFIGVATPHHARRVGLS
jgi:hypothetical protein